MIPALRAFARSFCRGATDADDLVQETLLKGIANMHRFEPGTNMKSWLFTILRNTFYTRIRKYNRESPSAEACVSGESQTQATQEWRVIGQEVSRAVRELPDRQREVVILISVLGISYIDAAEICGCAVGTVKSRLNRARQRLVERLGEPRARRRPPGRRGNRPRGAELIWPGRRHLAGRRRKRNVIMADPRDFGENDNSAAPLAGGTDASTDRDLGLGYGGSDDPNRRAGPLYDPGPEPGLGFGGSDDRGPGAMRDPAGESAGTAQALEGTEMGSPSDNIRSSRVKGTDVYNREGEHLGHIDDVVLSKREGRVVYAIMSFGGFLGIGERYHPLPWDKLDYDPSRGGYVVSISRAQLEGAPSYPPGEEPDWNDPSYGNELTRYYVPPLL